MLLKLVLTAAVAVVLVSCAPAKRSQNTTDSASIASETSAGEIQGTLHAIDVDRPSGSEGERASADYLERKLTEYGIAHTTYRARLYLSWPGDATVSVRGIPPVRGKTAAFAATTPPSGVRGELVLSPTLTRRVDRTLAFDAAVRGRIPVVRGIADTEALVLAAQQAGAIAVMQIDSTDTLHEDIVTTTWGTPTPESASRLPAIPYLIIGRSDGERLMRAAGAAPVAATVSVDVTRGWRTLPIVVADVAGRTPDFVLVATHLDAWYHGMTDTGGSVASILEMARILGNHQKELERGVRFAWWTGHSFGRYAGSAWYADRFWADLDRHCVAYTNLDGPGRRRSRMDGVAAAGWPGLAEYARDSAARLTEKTPAPARTAPFRPGRDSDSSFQGLGIPLFSIGVPGPDKSTGDIDAEGRVAYWHTSDDTFDKLDPKALELDTRYRLMQLLDLATMRLLPHRIEPIAASYVAALTDLAGAAGQTFDLSSTLSLAKEVEQAAARFDERREQQSTDPAARNALVVRLTHELNATLYTKAGRFDQDPAAELPVLPLLARVRDLSTLPRDGDDFGFLETEMVRGRNRVEANLRDALRELR